MSWLARIGVLGTGLLMLPSQGRAAETPSKADPMAVSRAVRRGLDFLAGQQKPDGSWHTDVQNPSVLGIMALAVTAFLADGNLPDEGPYGKTVARGLDFMLKSPMPDGVLCLSRSGHEMYEHGYCMLALAEAYGMTRDDRIQGALSRAVLVTRKSQAANGGWTYTAHPAANDISLSVTQLMALRAARNGGFFVPQRTVDQGLAYVMSCYDKNQGGFGYTPGMQASFTMTAAGVVSLQACGKYSADFEPVRRGLDFLKKHKTEFTPKTAGWYYYGIYYAAQGWFQAGGKHWEEMWPKLSAELVAAQEADGGWKGNSVGRIMGTSVSIIVLSMPKRYLPVFIQEQKTR